METRQVVCYGEVLWDVMDTGKHPGGAPMNVAYHLSMLGVRNILISRVGNDVDGEELLTFLERRGIATDFIQHDEHHSTGRVLATVSADDEVSYQIVAPVAWDFIQYDERLSTSMNSPDVLVYGSLAARNEISRNTLVQLLKAAKYRLFDLNLRPPHYTPELIDGLLRHADAAKLNLHELDQVSDWLDIGTGNERTRMGKLQDRYGLKEVIVTSGSQGASYFAHDICLDFPAIRVPVKDTVGSGDAFLAGFLARKLQGGGHETLLELATALGAYVTTRTGACPAYTRAELERFISRNVPAGGP